MKTIIRHPLRLLSAVCVVLAATLGLPAVAQEVVAAKASAWERYAETLKRHTQRGSDPWCEILSKDSYGASATFTLDAAPADWTELAREITVRIGGVECQPVISRKANAKGGSARFWEKSADGSLTCLVKWSKKTITVAISGSGSGYDFSELPTNFERTITVELGGLSAAIDVPLTVTGKTVTKKVRMSWGVEEYPLVSWSAKGAATDDDGNAADTSGDSYDSSTVWGCYMENISGTYYEVPLIIGPIPATDQASQDGMETTSP